VLEARLEKHRAKREYIEDFKRKREEVCLSLCVIMCPGFSKICLNLYINM